MIGFQFVFSPVCLFEIVSGPSTPLPTSPKSVRHNHSPVSSSVCVSLGSAQADCLRLPEYFASPPAALYPMEKPEFGLSGIENLVDKS